jgi:hypothetical protein
MQDIIRALEQRLRRLEREAVRLRIGEVTGTAPLDVSLGAADTSYEDVRALDGITLGSGDKIAALVAGNDLLVLGAIGDGRRVSRGTQNVSTTASVTGSATVNHGLGATPGAVIATAVQSTGLVNVTVNSVGATTFDLVIRYTNDVAASATVAVYWIAAL